MEVNQAHPDSWRYTDDEIAGLNQQRHKKNLRKKKTYFDNDPCLDVEIESEHGDWGCRD